MKNLILFIACFVLFSPALFAEEKITIASYYFPNYHTGEPRNDKRYGENWNEWELIKAAKPRFPGHQQPKVPLWGYTDEKDPKVMEMKIKAAADHGIDVFIFDWYIYEDGPFLNRCLDEGFLGAKNTNDLKFALMWANHHWTELFPASKGKQPELLWSATVSEKRYDEICDHIVKDYFTKPNYWKIDGKAYFSIWNLNIFIEGFGSPEKAKAGMDRLDAKAKAAGLAGVHWALPITNFIERGKNLGFESVSSYNWGPGVPDLVNDYNKVRDDYFRHWDTAKKEYGIPYFPNVSMGWDSSPRCNQADEYGNFGYPFCNVIINNTPENFKKALELTKERLLSDPAGPRVLTINCWNEWTEGSYLEPDTVHGMKYLEAVRDVFR